MEGRSRDPRKSQRVHYVISHYVIKTPHNWRTGASNKKIWLTPVTVVSRIFYQNRKVAPPRTQMPG